MYENIKSIFVSGLNYVSININSRRALCWSLFCYAYICDLSSFAIVLTRKRELVVFQ